MSVTHGLANTYKHGCRCDECRVAHTQGYADERRNRYAVTRTQGLPSHVPHGTASTYSNWGCRCDECYAAGSKKNRRDRQRRMTAASP